jgi:hypothetical protein
MVIKKKNVLFIFFYSRTVVFVDRNVSVAAPSCSPCLAKFLVNDTDKAVLDYKNTDWPTQLSPSSAIQQGFSVPKFSHHPSPTKTSSAQPLRRRKFATSFV